MVLVPDSVRRKRRAWVQDSTLYVPPMSTAVVEIPDDWSAVSSQSLARLLGL